MSAQNGDKARYGRLRKKKLARRVRLRDLRSRWALKKAEAPKSTPAKTAAPKKAAVEKVAPARAAKESVPVKKPAVKNAGTKPDAVASDPPTMLSK